MFFRYISYSCSVPTVKMLALTFHNLIHEYATFLDIFSIFSVDFCVSEVRSKKTKNPRAAERSLNFKLATWISKKVLSFSRASSRVRDLRHRKKIQIYFSVFISRSSKLSLLVVTFADRESKQRRIRLENLLETCSGRSIWCLIKSKYNEISVMLEDLSHERCRRRLDEIFPWHCAHSKLTRMLTTINQLGSGRGGDGEEKQFQVHVTRFGIGISTTAAM